MNLSDHNNLNDQPAGSPAPGSAGEDGSFDSSEFGDQDLGIIGSDAPKKKFNSGAMIVVIVVLIAAVGLYSMRTLTRASAAGSAPPEIERLIEEFLPAISKSGKATGGRSGVLGVLNESYAERQVPLTEVQRNPFIIFEDQGGAKAAAVSPTAPLDTRRRARTAQLEQAAGKLRLGMILMGSQPLANINNKVVRVGEAVVVEGGIEFRVVAIAPNRVDLVAVDEELEITVEKSLAMRRD